MSVCGNLLNTLHLYHKNPKNPEIEVLLKVDIEQIRSFDEANKKHKEQYTKALKHIQSITDSKAHEAKDAKDTGTKEPTEIWETVDKTGTSKTPLMWAAQYGWEEAVKQILTLRASTRIFDPQIRSALYYAAMSGNLVIVKLLHEIDPKVLYRPDGDKQTALVAAILGEHNTVVEYFCNLENLSSVEQKLENQQEYLKKLINFEDKNGMTPLCHAVSMLNVDAVRALLKAGAEVTHKFETHQYQDQVRHFGNILHLLLYPRQKEDKVIFKKQVEIFDLFLQHTAELSALVNEFDSYSFHVSNFTPFHLACLSCNSAIVKRMIEAKAVAVTPAKVVVSNGTKLPENGSSKKMPAISEVSVSCLQLACQNRGDEIEQQQTVQELLKIVPISEVDFKKLFDIALKNLRPYVIDTLFAAAKDLIAYPGTIRNEFGENLLFDVIFDKQSIEDRQRNHLLRILINKCRLDLNCTTTRPGYEGQTVFMVAIVICRAKVIEFLLSYSFLDITRKDANNRTALTLAAIHSKIEALELTVDKKPKDIKPNEEDKDGFSALFYALQNNLKISMNLIVKVKAVTIKLSNPQRSNLFHALALVRNITLVDKVIAFARAQNKDIEYLYEKNKQNETPFHRADKNQSYSTLRIFIETALRDRKLYILGWEDDKNLAMPCYEEARLLLSKKIREQKAKIEQRQKNPATKLDKTEIKADKNDTLFKQWGCYVLGAKQDRNTSKKEAFYNLIISLFYSFYNSRNEKYIVLVYCAMQDGRLTIFPNASRTTKQYMDEMLKQEIVFIYEQFKVFIEELNTPAGEILHKQLCARGMEKLTLRSETQFKEAKGEAASYKSMLEPKRLGRTKAGDNSANGESTQPFISNPLSRSSRSLSLTEEDLAQLPAPVQTPHYRNQLSL